MLAWCASSPAKRLPPAASRLSRPYAGQPQIRPGRNKIFANSGAGLRQSTWLSRILFLERGSTVANDSEAVNFGGEFGFHDNTMSGTPMLERALSHASAAKSLCFQAASRTLPLACLSLACEQQNQNHWLNFVRFVLSARITRTETCGLLLGFTF